MTAEMITNRDLPAPRNELKLTKALCDSVNADSSIAIIL